MRQAELAFRSGEAHRGRASATKARLLAGLRLIPVVAILVGAAGLRFVGLDWDAGQHLHPDERFITIVESRVQLPSGLTDYFDTAHSLLNPYNRDFGSYIYGTLPLFLVRAVAEGLQQAARAVEPGSIGLLDDLLGHLRQAADYGEIHRVGRVLSGLEDLATVWLVFLIGRRLYGRSVGLVAALLSALAVLQIQAAHFFTAESPVVLLTTLAFFFAVRVAQTDETWSWVLLGIAGGLAVATKLTAGLGVVLIAAAAAIIWYRRARLGEARFSLEELATGVAAAGLAALIAFRVAQPYAFTGPGFFDLAPNPKYLADLANWQRIATGQADYPPSDQWTGTIPYLWQGVNMALWGLGPPLFLAAWLGVVLAAVQLVRYPARHYLHLVGLVWVLGNFLYWGPQFAKPMRYLLPIYPQLTIFAAFFIVTLWAWARSGDFPVGPGWRLSLRAGKVVAGAIAAVVLGWTGFYALAFASIYTHSTTRVAASEWIYANVPPGSAVGWEHWDDPLPLRLPGTDSGQYPGVEFPMYNDDTPAKRDQLVEKLGRADYLVLSSNRLYGSIPKLPLRYPMTTRYYQALFSGELGFEPAAEFTGRPSFLGVELNDDNAEEIFTVYEHPKVTIFQKAPGYSTENTRRVLESTPLDQALRGLKPIDARSGGLLLSAGEGAAARAGGTWSDIFDPDSLPNQVPLVVWYLTLQALALAAFPLLSHLCRGLVDRGYALAKTVGWLAIAYLPWLWASLHLLEFSRFSIALSALLLAAGSGLFASRHWRELRAFLMDRWRLLLATEGLFAGVLLIFTLIRSANPDLWHPVFGGEKPMDFAYLNAVIRSSWFPPYDPWLAGGYINYYYFGQAIVASLIKLTGIVPWVAYNLAVPTLAALTAINAASVAFHLLVGRAHPAQRQIWAGMGAALAAFLAVGAGNLQALEQVLTWLDRVGGGPTPSVVPGIGTLVGGLRGMLVGLGSLVSGRDLPPLNFSFWDSTRVITTEPVTPITEFPFFTFLYADLHAHMIAMPLALLALGLGINLVRQPLDLPSGWRTLRLAPTPAPPPRLGEGWGERAPSSTSWSEAARVVGQPGLLVVLLAALVLGVLRMTNTWDYPTYWGLIVVAIFVGLRFRARRPLPVALAATVVCAGLLFVFSSLFAAPFLARYQQFYSGLELTSGHTNLAQYLTVLGIFWACVGTYAFCRLQGLRSRLQAGAWSLLGLVEPAPLGAAVVGAPWPRVLGPTRETLAVAAGLGAVLIALVASLAGLPVVGVAAAGLVALALVVILRPHSPAALYTMLMVAGALALTMVVEIVVLQGDIGRMNTVFKFYIQVWLLLAVASAVMVTLLTRRLVGSPRLQRGGRGLVALGLALLLGASAVYPLLGTPDRLRHRFVAMAPSLDGMAFMAQAHHSENGQDVYLADDFAAIRWLLQNVDGTPVMAEATQPIYHWASRVSIYTGLPTIVGWDWHQKQQRGDFGFMVDDRLKDLAAIFGPASPQATLDLLRKYHVEYVYVGGLERALYPADSLRKFEAMVPSALDRAYVGGTVTVYRLRAL